MPHMRLGLLKGTARSVACGRKGLANSKSG
jgi:hypothetical protein